MKRILLSLTLFGLILVEISCSSFGNNIVQKVLLPPLETGAKVSLINYDSVYYLMNYYLSKGSWPATKEVLNDFAVSKNYKINFEQYKYYSIEQCSTNRINIHFVIKKVEIDNLYVKDVKGIVSIYIEDANKTEIYNHEDKKIISSFTVAKYPYDKTNIEVPDGYSVHQYIEYMDSYLKGSNERSTTIRNQPMFKIQELNFR